VSGNSNLVNLILSFFFIDIKQYEDFYTLQFINCSPNTMKATIFFSGQPVSTFTSLHSCYSADEFESPARSTVPSIAYWSAPDDRITELAAAFQVPAPKDCVMEFEYKTPPPKGQGKDSHTDLMISWHDVAVGIEAKYTEPHYEMVAEWIGQGKDASNRHAVLQGWLGLITQRTGEHVLPSAIPSLTYQMIHRLASVCSRPEPHRFVLYQVFNPDVAKKDYYRTELDKLRAAIGRSDNVRIFLSWVTFTPSPDYQHLLARWEKHKRPCRYDVISGLVSRSLMTFQKPTFEEVK
jgi:hypothetical protein